MKTPSKRSYVSTDGHIITRIYVTSEGGWWSFKPEQWEELLKKALRGEEINLNATGKVLQYPPSSAVETGTGTDSRDGGRSRRRASSKRSNVLAYNVLDWEVGEWEQAALDFHYQTPQ